MRKVHENINKYGEKREKEWRSMVLGNINAHFERYQHFYKYGVIGGVLWLIGIIFMIIFS